jgi:hypothetical protein
MPSNGLGMQHTRRRWKPLDRSGRKILNFFFIWYEDTGLTRLAEAGCGDCFCECGNESTCSAEGWGFLGQLRDFPPFMVRILN